jgi:hypothetical protein
LSNQSNIFFKKSIAKTHPPRSVAEKKSAFFKKFQKKINSLSQCEQGFIELPLFPHFFHLTNTAQLQGFEGTFPEIEV